MTTPPAGFQLDTPALPAGFVLDGGPTSAEKLAAINAGVQTPQQEAAFIEKQRATAAQPRQQEGGVAEFIASRLNPIQNVIDAKDTVGQIVKTNIAVPVATIGGIVDAFLAGKFGTPEGANQAEATANRLMQQMAPADQLSPNAQQNLQMIGAATQPLMALGPDPASMIGPGPAVAAMPAATTRVAATLDKAVTAVPAAARRMQEIAKPAEAATPGTMGSVGTAGVDMATQRRALAESFPVPIPKLTKGQATRDPAQLKFEEEAAKLPDQGAPLRERRLAQNDAILRNFDVFQDQTGAQAPTLRETGVVVDSALVKQAAADKVKMNVAYAEARKAGEMAEPVTLDSVVAAINDASPDTDVAPLVAAARKRALRYGIATEDAAGELVPAQTDLNTAERFRASINQATDYEPQNIRYASIFKRAIDDQTAGLGGNLYQYARKLRERNAQNYENHAVISKLLNEKRGTTDRQVAMEDVFSHSMLKGSTDDVRQVRRVLQRAGPDGHQAWSELQGATVRWIKEEATKNVATDSTGNRVISPAGLDKAITTLDADGRLEVVFGKKGAQQMRDLNELAKVARTIPPEAGVNASNTAMTLLAAFGDVGITGLSGVPAPLITSSRMALRYIKDVQLRKRILQALGEAEEKAKRKPTNPPPPSYPAPPAPPQSTVH